MFRVGLKGSGPWKLIWPQASPIIMLATKETIRLRIIQFSFSVFPPPTQRKSKRRGVRVIKVNNRKYSHPKGTVVKIGATSYIMSSSQTQTRAQNVG